MGTNFYLVQKNFYKDLDHFIKSIKLKVIVAKYNYNGENIKWIIDKLQQEHHVNDIGIHIGKSSYGHRYMFHDDAKNRTKEDWENTIADPNKEIIDEYYNVFPKNEFWDMVSQKQKSALREYEARYGNYYNHNGYAFQSGEFS